MTKGGPLSISIRAACPPEGSRFSCNTKDKRCLTCRFGAERPDLRTTSSIRRGPPRNCFGHEPVVSRGHETLHAVDEDRVETDEKARLLAQNGVDDLSRGFVGARAGDAVEFAHRHVGVRIAGRVAKMAAVA